MKKEMILILGVACVLAACHDGNPRPEGPEEPSITYANQFTVVGDIEAPGIWEEGETLSAVDPSTGANVGNAEIIDGAGTSSATFILSTDLEKGASVCLVRAEASLPSVQEQKGGDCRSLAAYSYGKSAAVTLDTSFPARFTMPQPCVPLGIRIEAAGQTYGSAKISSFALSMPDRELASGSESVTVTLAEPLAVGNGETAWMVVLPVQGKGRTGSLALKGKDASGKDLSLLLDLEGDNLVSGTERLLHAVLPDAVMTPGQPSASDETVTVAYKKTAETASYSQAQALLVDGMKRMAHYNASSLDRWGGYAGVKPDAVVSSNPEGFWRTGRYKGRWVCVNPDGNVTILHGVNGVAPNSMKESASALAQAEYDKKFPSTVDWAAWSGKMLSDYGFNFFSTNPKRIRLYPENYGGEVQRLLRETGTGTSLGQVEILYLLRTFSWDYYSITHTSFDASQGSVFTLMFDPDYLDYIDALAADGTAPFQGDKAFIGYYLDNELQFRFSNAATPAIYLKQWLALDSSSSVPRAFSYAKAYAEAFMRDRYGVEPVAANVTSAMEDAFLADICDYYYRTAAEAVRRHDPDHLILGSRLHGKPKTLPQVHAACARYCDVVSVNVYGVWEPNDPYFISQYKVWAPDKPCFVTEFYTRDALATFGGALYGNTGEGGGWIVKGQESRGRHYQNFTRKLLSYDHCIGWQWFQMTDDYSETYGWNNKGLVAPSYEPYTGCLDLMRQLHWNIYQILDYYHSPSGAPSSPASGVRTVWWN